MIKPPYTKWINDIKTKLGFNRTMTAFGEDVVDAVNKQAQQITNVQNGLATPSITGTANNIGNTIIKGTYFRLNDVLCFAITNIADGATFTVNTNYRIVSEGGLNALGNVIDFAASVTASEHATIKNKKASKYGRIAIISFLVTVNTKETNWTKILNIPAELLPYAEYYSIVINDADSSAAEGRIGVDGVSIWRPVVGNDYIGTIVYMTSI